MPNQADPAAEPDAPPDVLRDGYGGTTPAPSERPEPPRESSPSGPNEPEQGTPLDDATSTVSAPSESS